MNENQLEDHTELIAYIKDTFERREHDAWEASRKLEFVNDKPVFKYKTFEDWKNENT